MHMQGDSVYSQCQGYDPGIMATMRHRLKNSHFTNFPQLLHALSFTDKARTTDPIIKQLYINLSHFTELVIPHFIQC